LRTRRRPSPVQAKIAFGCDLRLTLGRFVNYTMAKPFHKKINKLPLLRLIIAFLLLAVGGALASLQPSFAYAQKSFLWKIQSTHSTVYLLGSIHFLKEDVYPLDQTIENAYESSDRLVVEANINDLGKLDLKRLADQAFYKNGDDLEKHLSPETYRLIQKESKSLDMPIDLIRMQKPWFLALSFEATELMRLGYDPQYGVDYHFLAKAQGKKEILELESLDEQLSLLSGYSDKEQEQFLLYTLNTLSSMGGQVEGMVRAWTSGDVQGLESIIADSVPPDASLAPVLEKLFDERNIKMSSKIEGYLNSKGSYFVIVGAGHLVGKRGIIELIKSKGYVIQQL
jgi:uncharacterized protein YbaP (TraB family)